MTQQTIVKDDEFSEMYDAQIDRVDLVGGAANGHRFLMAKSYDASMMPADAVRGLIQKFDEENTVATTQTEPIAKDLEVGDLIEAAAPGSTADTVPGSPDWETKDSDSAFNVINTLGRVKEAVQYLAGREAQEGATGDDWDDWDNEWDLTDAAAALDYAISLLAPYATSEKLEADMEDELLDVTKAVAGFPAGSLDALMGLVAIRKAGRVLSTANETSLRDAVTSATSAIESITKVLAALPDVPAEVETVEKGTPVAEKQETVTEPVEKAEETPVVQTPAEEPVVKADDPAPEPSDEILVYDANGNILGSIDPANLRTFAPTPSTGVSEEPQAGAEPTSADLEPQPSADAGTAVTKGTSKPADDMSVEQLLKDAEGSDDPSIKALAKALVGAQAEVELYKSQPAPSGVIANGGPIPTDANLRGQNVAPAGGSPVDQARVSVLKSQMTSGKTAAERKQAADKLQELAAASLVQIHATGGAPMFGGR